MVFYMPCLTLVKEPYSFNFTEHFTRRDLITFFLQPSCNVTLHIIGNHIGETMTNYTKISYD